MRVVVLGSRYRRDAIYAHIISLRLVDTDDNFSMRGSELEKAVKEDREKVKAQFFYFSTRTCTVYERYTSNGCSYRITGPDPLLCGGHAGHHVGLLI